MTQPRPTVPRESYTNLSFPTSHKTFLNPSLQKNNSESVEASTKWAVGCSVVSLLIAGVVTAMHLHALASSMIVGTKIEGVLAIVLAASWAACVAVVTNASNGLGIENDNTVKNANLYYFSWAGFVASIVLLVSYLREAFGVDVVGNIRERGARLTQWAALLATSLIVMGSSARTFSNQCQPNLSGDDAYCARTKFGIALGVLAVMGSLAIVGMKMLIAAAPLKMELGVSGVLAILNAFGVAYITSAKGPGATIGNLYYSM